MTERNFIFIVYEKYGIPEMMFLVNKKEFISVFNKNIDIFRRVYGMQITAEAFLKDLIDKKITPPDLFEQNDLLGILLGYGRHNAELFQRREKLFEKRNLMPFWRFLPPEKLVMINKELEDIERSFDLIQDGSFWLVPVSPVCFAGDTQDAETRILVKKYGLLHKKLTSLFRKEDWLYQVITKLESAE